MPVKSSKASELFGGATPDPKELFARVAKAKRRRKQIQLLRAALEVSIPHAQMGLLSDAGLMKRTEEVIL